MSKAQPEEIARRLNEMQELISVVICTYNRAELARQAIVSVLAQDFPPNSYELLIVDNNSADHTRAMVQEFCEQYPNVRYFLERNVGLSYARNRGWQAARGEYVAYIDDDCKVPLAWLRAASRVIEQGHPDAFGGPYLAFYNSPKPAWFKDEYGSHVQGQAGRLLQAGEYLDGGNLFLRVAALKSLGGFDTGLGMQGSKIGYGEETGLLNSWREHAAKIVYAPEVFVYHLVRPEKMRLWPNLVMNFSGGYSYAKIVGQPTHGDLLHTAYAMLRNCSKVVKCALRIARSVAWDVLRRDRLQYPFSQNFFYEVSFQQVTDLGYLIGLFSVEKRGLR